YEQLDTIIRQNHIEKLIIEELFMFKNQKTVIKVAQSIGVIEVLAANNNLPIHRFTPLEVKSIVTGYGSADKQAVQKMVQLTIKEAVTFKDDDQTDAIACGLAYCFYNENLA